MDDTKTWLILTGFISYKALKFGNLSFAIMFVRTTSGPFCRLADCSLLFNNA